MQLCSSLTREGPLKCRPGGSRTLDMVRPVILSNVWLFFFFPHRKLKVGAASSLLSKEKEGHALYFTASLCCACSCVPASVVVLAAC